MKHSKTLFAVTVASLIVPAAAIYAQPEQSAKEIMQHANETMKLEGMEESATLTIADDKGNVRERKFSTASKDYAKDGVKKAIMRFLSPADVKGTSILTFDYDTKDDDMWIYMPALRKTRRIASSEKSKGFMGSEFTNSDISSPNLDEYTFKTLGNETVGDVECWKIEMVPVSDDIKSAYGYSKRVSLVGKKDYVTRKSSYYDLDGQLLKELNVSEIKLMDAANKKYQPVKSQMVNKQNGRVSTFTIDKSLFNPNVKDSYFTTQYLEKP
jgi:hypothetical protein